MSHFFGQGYMINNGGQTLQIANMNKAVATLSNNDLLNIKNLEVDQNISEIPLMFLHDKIETISIRGGSFRNIPERIFELKKLKSISVTLSGLSVIDERIGDLTELTSLDVSSNYISSLPNSLANLTKLSYLNIGHTNIAELSVLTGLKELKKLVLPADLRGKVPSTFICQEIKFAPAWHVWSNSKE